MNPIRKSRLALVLQVGVVLLGMGTLALLLWEPHVEGRNVRASAFGIYFEDPFLAYAYIGSIPFFVALHRAFQLLGDVRRKGAFSQTTVDGLRAIRKCAIATIGFIAGGAIILLMFGDKEDRPPGVLMCVLFTSAASVAAIMSAMLARKLQQTLEQPEGSRD